MYQWCPQLTKSPDKQQKSNYFAYFSYIQYTLTKIIRACIPGHIDVLWIDKWFILLSMIIRYVRILIEFFNIWILDFCAMY